MPKPGPESTLEDVRALLIQTGVDDLLEAGLGTGVERLKLADVIEAAGVSRATAYRSLFDEALNPQETMRRDVLKHVVGRSARQEQYNSTVAAATAEFTLQADALASSDVALRTQAMRSILLVAANSNFFEVAASRERAVLTAMSGALRSIPADQLPEERDALRSGEEGISHRFVEMYAVYSELFGYRLKSHYEPHHFSTAIASVIDGTVMRDGYSEFLADIKRPTGPDGADESWTLFAILFEATYLAFWEPKDAANPFCDLRNY